MEYDQFGTIVEERFNIDLVCQFYHPLHHIFFGEDLNTMCDYLFIAASSACLLHYFIAYQRYRFRLIELHSPSASPAGYFSQRENSKSILLFGCQFAIAV